MAPIVLDDDSDDDMPLHARSKQPVSAGAGKKADDSSSDDEPEWMKTFKSPQEIVDDLDDDDDDDDDRDNGDDDELVTSPGKQFEMTSTPAKMAKPSPAPANARAKEGKEGEDDDDDDEEEEEEAKSDQGGGGAGAASADDVAKVAAASTAGTWGRSSATAVTMGALPTPNRPGELPLLMPASLNRAKVFFECEGSGEAVDLEGDVGVVGRLLSDASDKNKAGLQMDLKGVIYNAKILPTPASIVILAVNQTEAKIESIANDYVQLREDLHANVGGGTLDGYLGADSDDEDHQVRRAAAGSSAAAAVRAMDDVSDDDEGGGGGGKRKRGGAGGGGAGNSQKLGADGSRKKAKSGGRKPAKKGPKKTSKKKRGK